MRRRTWMLLAMTMIAFATLTTISYVRDFREKQAFARAGCEEDHRFAPNGQRQDCSKADASKVIVDHSPLWWEIAGGFLWCLLGLSFIVSLCIDIRRSHRRLTFLFFAATLVLFALPFSVQWYRDRGAVKDCEMRTAALPPIHQQAPGEVYIRCTMMHEPTPGWAAGMFSLGFLTLILSAASVKRKSVRNLNRQRPPSQSLT